MNTGFIKALKTLVCHFSRKPMKETCSLKKIINREYLFFSVKDRNLFHRVDTIGNIFTSGAATRENITDGVHEMK